jgi:hypothetical protein
MKPTQSIFAGLVLLGLALPSGWAQVLIYNYTAIVTSVTDQQGVFPDSLTVGNEVTGTFSVDCGASVLFDFGTEKIYQDTASGIERITAFVDETSVSALGDVVRADDIFTVVNRPADQGGDRLDRAADAAAAQRTGFTGTPDFTFGGTFLVSLSGPETVFPDTSIPKGLEFADFTGFNFVQFQAVDAGFNISQFSADLTSFVLVPEPAAATVVFASLSLAGVAVRRLRRRTSPRGQSRLPRLARRARASGGSVVAGREE